MTTTTREDTKRDIIRLDGSGIPSATSPLEGPVDHLWPRELQPVRNEPERKM